jgi:hypothetical protein
MRANPLLIGLAATVLLASPAMAQASDLVLSPIWPDRFEDARSQPLPLVVGTPAGEDDRSYGPKAPGSASSGTQASITYAIQTPEGDPGPVGLIDLDPSKPVVLDVYLSADATPEPTGLEPAPVSNSQGVAPELTVHAELAVDGTVTDEAEQTETLVSAPGTDRVTHYRFDLHHDREILEPGTSFEVRYKVSQAAPDGEAAHQPLWNVHTGGGHPSGLTLPAEVSIDPVTEPVTTDSLREPTERNPEASLAFATSSLVAIAAAGRMVYGYVGA